jgi:hypothetical protein
MNRRAHKSFRPSLEVLESRWTPTITPIDCNPDVAGNDGLLVLGTAGPDRVIVTDDPFADTITVEHDVGNNGTIDFTETTSTLDYCVQADLGAGNDILVYNVQSDYSGHSKSLFVVLGTGNDRVTFNTNGFDITNSSEWIIEIAESPSDQIVGGNDRVFLNFASQDDQGTNTSILNSAVSVTVELGAGQDEVTTNFDGDIGDNTGEADSGVDIAVSLGLQNDKFSGLFDLDFFDIFNDGELAIRVDGGRHTDQIRLARNPMFLNSGPATLQGRFEMVLQGGYGADTIEVAFDTSASGNDAFTSSSLGSIELRVSGDDGVDNIQVRLSNDASATLNYDVIVRGGTGADSMGLSIVADAGSTVTFAPLGFALLDAGMGADSLLFNVGNVQRRSI